MLSLHRFFILVVIASALALPSPNKMADMRQISFGNDGRNAIVSTLRDLYSETSRMFSKPQAIPTVNEDYIYWSFLPRYDGSLSVPTSKPVELGPQHCYLQNTVTVKPRIGDTRGTLDITISFNKKNGNWTGDCTDLFLFATLSDFQVVETLVSSKAQPHYIEWIPSNNMTADEKWDYATNGIRIFDFKHRKMSELMYSVHRTLELLNPMFEGPAVPDRIAEMNVSFMKNYVGRTLTKRKITDVVIPEASIRPGDFFGICRLDGVDPMLAWAMGSNTGHVTVAIRDPATNKLYVAESTGQTVYWPYLNGVQITPYQQWIKWAKAASMNVVYAPLSPEMSKKFDNNAAWKWFKTVEGNDYGFVNMIFSWIDTVKDNYPCLPPDYTHCFNWEFVEVASGLVDRLAPAGTDLVWNQGFNNRLNTTGLRPAALYRHAVELGFKTRELAAIVEQDSYRYQLKHVNGSIVTAPAAVCSVFVCYIYKAGGLFGNLPVNCGEQTNLDMYGLDLFDRNWKRPEVCVAADPDNDFCQLLGKYTLTLDNHSIQGAPYAWMHQRCPTIGPKYEQPKGC